MIFLFCRHLIKASSQQLYLQKQGWTMLYQLCASIRSGPGLGIQFSALVHNFNNIFSIGHLCLAGHSMNILPSHILDVACNAEAGSDIIRNFKPLESLNIQQL